MTAHELRNRVEELAEELDKLPKEQRVGLQSSLDRMVDALKEKGRAAGPRVRRSTFRADDDDDDFFDNMPV